VVETTCEQGTIEVRLQIGQQSVGVQRLAIERTGSVQSQYNVSRTVWGEGLDAVPKKAPTPMFRTAVIRLRVELTCSKPWEVGPGLGPYLEVADFRSFVAGFATGE
jgi:hypothetical protein